MDTGSAATGTATPRSGATPLLVVDDLCTAFETPGGRLARAVDGVTFTLDAGETLGIVGESGSGKSVLVRTIMQLLPSAGVRQSGTVSFDGRDVRALSPKQARHFWGGEVAMIFQDPMTALNPVKRVGAHITESLRYHKHMSRKRAVATALELMDLVGIPAPQRRLRQYPHELSGGMRQRVTIAMALACEPRLLIADEPTTALDVTVQKQILELLGRLQRERNMAMIFITHDLGVVAGRTDRVAVMYAGRIVEMASTHTLFARHEHPYTEALLASIPRIRERSHTRLQAIGGRPPDIVNLPTGCRFAPRCSYAQDHCCEVDPPLVDVTADHRHACLVPVGSRAESGTTVGVG